MWKFMPNQPDNKTKELTQTIANAFIIIRNTENKGRIVISVLSGIPQEPENRHVLPKRKTLKANVTAPDWKNELF